MDSNSGLSQIELEKISDKIDNEKIAAYMSVHKNFYKNDYISKVNINFYTT